VTEISIGLFFFFVILYTLVAGYLGRYSITMAMVFVLVGAIAGAHGLGWVSFPINSLAVERITEIALALLLFADASTLSFQRRRQDNHILARLLLMGMPLAIILGALVAFLLYHDQGFRLALLIGAILAPTDAALGLPIFNNPRMPAPIRRALNFESGLNDGIAAPIVTVFIALAVTEGAAHQQGALLRALIEIAIAVLVGIVMGRVGGWLFIKATKRGWTSIVSEQIGNLALALGAFFVARGLGGNGFIAAFVSGLLFGHVARDVLHRATEFTESTGNLLSLFVWTVFGSSLAASLLVHFNLRAFLYGLLSLTLIRMLPVAIAMIGVRFRRDTVLMMGWLGPRGLASVVFLMMAIERFYEEAKPPEVMIAFVSWAILLSVFLHGLSALPLASWYARRLETAAPGAPELVEAPSGNAL
jgi:NhaP-type Na+/H+ or K+/H+ antiporter